MTNRGVVPTGGYALRTGDFLADGVDNDNGDVLPPVYPASTTVHHISVRNPRGLFYSGCRSKSTTITTEREHEEIEYRDSPRPEGGFSWSDVRRRNRVRARYGDERTEAQRIAGRFSQLANGADILRRRDLRRQRTVADHVHPRRQDRVFRRKRRFFPLYPAGNDLRLAVRRRSVDHAGRRSVFRTVQRHRSLHLARRTAVVFLIHPTGGWSEPRRHRLMDGRAHSDGMGRADPPRS